MPGWIELENNIKVNFSDGFYAERSYWQIPARIGIDALACGRHAVIPNSTGRLTAFLTRFLPVPLITHFVERSARPKGDAVA